jgi:hypothetical protein
MPVPPPQQGAWHDPDPARCSIEGCREIIDAHPASREDGQWEGYCQFHGMVLALYGGTQDSEYGEEEEA